MAKIAKPAEREKAETTHEMIEQISKDNNKWVAATELAFKTRLPDMGAILSRPRRSRRMQRS